MTRIIGLLDKFINDLYHAGIGNDDARMMDAWRQFDALVNKETHAPE